ncbi:fumarylacetoacetate hydrolase family protein [Phaeovulum sp.]|uniref:fumarylacetoacetate hydrolase family protein n=1 Tax=Phaeovulum sp. TaxID=2934796 RepID=UPI0039E5850A
MGWIFEPAQTIAVPVEGEVAQFPVRRVFCVGRNYVEHAREMGNEVDREAPFYFTKSAQAVVATGATVPYPPGTSDYHHEMELVIAIGAPAFKVSAGQALRCVYGYAAGLDMTRRDLQTASKSKRRPWDTGKDFENSAVIAPIRRAEEVGAIGPQRIALSVNGQMRQDSVLSDMVWSVPEIISHLSTLYHLMPGDLIYTGTPAGVGPVGPGDVIEGTIDGLAPIRLMVGAPD